MGFGFELFIAFRDCSEKLTFILCLFICALLGIINARALFIMPGQFSTPAGFLVVFVCLDFFFLQQVLMVVANAEFEPTVHFTLTSNPESYFSFSSSGVIDVHNKIWP